MEIWQIITLVLLIIATATFYDSYTDYIKTKEFHNKLEEEIKKQQQKINKTYGFKEINIDHKNAS